VALAVVLLAAIILIAVALPGVLANRRRAKEPTVTVTILLDMSQLAAAAARAADALQQFTRSR